MLRTFRRSGLPVWYTEGFNPHPYYSFALALSLGYESICEILDFNLNEPLPFDEVRRCLNSVMPEGMSIRSVSEPIRKVTAIAKAEYVIRLTADDPERLSGDIERLMAGENILVEKKTKKGAKIVDIKPSTEIISCKASGNISELVMRLPAGTQTNFNPTLFLDALKNADTEPFEILGVCRTAILCENNEIFL